MASHKLIYPSIEILSKIVKDVIQPKFVEIERELDRKISVQINLLVQEDKSEQIKVVPPGVINPESQDIQGEVRITFRETFVSDRLLFFIETLFDKNVSPDTGYSGFKQKGEVVTGSERTSVKSKSMIARYNVWKWETNLD